MISEQEIERLGNQLADLGDWSGEEGSALIDHLDDADTDAVLDRAGLISICRSWADHTDSLVDFVRLGQATGCPDGEPIFPWLKDRGLVEEVDGGGFRFKTARPGAVT
jgi:hypothetical protein